MHQIWRTLDADFRTLVKTKVMADTATYSKVFRNIFPRQYKERWGPKMYNATTGPVGRRT